jgi:hypothetical protein
MDPNLVPTDDDGRFTCVLSNHEARLRTSIAAFLRDPRRGDEVPRDFPLTVVHSVRPGTTDLDVRIPATRYPLGWLSGRIVDEHGEAAVETVSLRDLETGKRRRVQFDPLGVDGSFASGPIPAGRYTLVVRTEPIRQFGPFVVRPGEPLDVGTLRFDRTAPRPAPGAEQRVERFVAFVAPDDAGVPGSLHVEVRDAQRRIVADVWLRRHTDGSWRERLRLPNGRLHLTATTSTGLGAAKELVVDDAEPQYRAILIPLTRSR